ncbi:TetR/AcrR family transcriptional regulator [Aquimarina sediminis]|uniref:TetR/AcrR family transcriptional regulator n=1 Tax=Aquimarina sediminis TaxID=2070536 RepID=UPI000CA01E96|nr:TetR/AcrR family transcriptional regulator [Aquimarina sediminis]
MPKIVAQKTDWIKLGYTLFAEQGISGIVVEKMAKKLNCNKSSFYWHFKTKKVFINEIIDFWVLSDTEQIITLINTEKTAKQKFETLVALSFVKDPYLDFIFYLKRYAQKEKTIQNIIDKIDHQRIEFVADLLQEMEFSKEEAKVKSTLFYKYLIGYHEMIRYKQQSKSYVKEVLAEINHFIKY